ncbi:anaphase-promoting complex subunit Hcn1 [Rhizoclosmatium sp. JEL0117]|nr:anaphase-promoting complex subunit Hcn1 [Rhizoclosmatium sp. JEL0117]
MEIQTLPSIVELISLADEYREKYLALENQVKQFHPVAMRLGQLLLAARSSLETGGHLDATTFVKSDDNGVLNYAPRVDHHFEAAQSQPDIGTTSEAWKSKIEATQDHEQWTRDFSQAVEVNENSSARSSDSSFHFLTDVRTKAGSLVPKNTVIRRNTAQPTSSGYAPPTVEVEQKKSQILVLSSLFNQTTSQNDSFLKTSSLIKSSSFMRSNSTRSKQGSIRSHQKLPIEQNTSAKNIQMDVGQTASYRVGGNEEALTAEPTPMMQIDEAAQGTIIRNPKSVSINESDQKIQMEKSHDPRHDAVSISIPSSSKNRNLNTPLNILKGKNQHQPSAMTRSRATLAQRMMDAALLSKFDLKGSLASIELAEGAATPEDISLRRHGINPLSSLYVLSQFFFSIIHLTKLWIVPFCLSFESDIPAGYSIFLTVCNVCDIILEFLTPNTRFFNLMQANQDLQLRDWQIYYLTHGFLLDLVTALPLDMLPFNGAHYMLAIRLIRLYKVPPIFLESPIYIQMMKNIQRWLGIGHSASLIFPLMVLFCVFLHIEACAIFLTSRLEGFSNIDIEPYRDASIERQYTWALFASIGNTFPLGYKPARISEQWLVLMFTMVGAGLYAAIVGAVSSFAMGFDASGRLYKQKLDELHEYMTWKDLAPSTRRKILKYYDLKYRGKYFEEATLLNEMNDSLRMEIAIHNCKDLISKVSFLRRQENDGRDELFVGKVASAFEPCYFVTGDIIFTQGQVGMEMYFVVSGTINVLAQGKHVATLNEGAFFGEVALIGNIPRTATVQAAGSCMLYRLTRASFTSILEEFEDVKRTVDGIYRERMARVAAEEEAKKMVIARDLASKVPFLNRAKNDGRDEDFLGRIGHSLVSMLLVNGDVVFAQGDEAGEMYFIKRGSVDIRIQSKTVSSLTDGDFFGELALIANIPRTATAQATATCVIYKLTRESLKKILEEFPDVQEQIDIVYQERFQKFKTDDFQRNGGK